ncbi:MAG: L,D-transpeptidase [Prevotellaceae bacterium]|nr:L,D-transpeptidase [Prevotellaceae bacterium]
MLYCANNKPKIDIKLNIALPAIDSLCSIRKPSSLPSMIMEKFDGWELDSINCIENIEEATRFIIRGKGLTDIPKREMFVRALDVHTDSLRSEIWSYVVLHKIIKNKPFEAEALYIPTAGTIIVYNARADSLKKDDKTDIILASKQDMKLRMINCNDTVTLTLPMATGKNPGNKTRSGDKKTPEGIFTVYAIHDASDWDYDFNDGKGRIKGTYGKYFVRFKEHYHIGIHGTHLPHTLGMRATEGCLRLHNNDIDRIVPMISRSKTLIVVTPAMEDVIND